MKSVVHEPLFHFLILGGILFAAYAWINRGEAVQDSAANNRIHITEGDIRWMTETWSKQWQRQPTSEELDALVTDFVREQLLAREALELGLGENDTLIRRRLAQKVEFLVRDTALLAEPDEQELRLFFERNASRYHSDGILSFVHVFFDAERRVNATDDARASLAGLVEGPDPAMTLGDRSLLGHEFTQMTGSAVRSLFGSEFAQEIMKLRPNVWAGPIESAYGAHLVYVTSLDPPAPQPFEAVRDRVRNDWESEQQRRTNQAYLESLLQKYEVVIDAPGIPLSVPKNIARGNRI